MTTKSSSDDLRLYSFTWKDGGFNQVYASSRREALAKANKLWRGHEAQPASLKRWRKGTEDEYYRSLPLMD